MNNSIDLQFNLNDIKSVLFKWYTEEGYLLNNEQIEEDLKLFKDFKFESEKQAKEIISKKFDKNIIGRKLTNKDLNRLIENLDYILNESGNSSNDFKISCLKEIENPEIKQKIKKMKRGFNSFSNYIDDLLSLTISIYNKLAEDYGFNIYIKSVEEPKHIFKVANEIEMNQENVQKLIKALINNSYVYLEFIKDNGEIRKMKATRRNEINGFSEFNSIKHILNELKAGLIKVYDLENNGIRTFHVENLITFQLDNGITYIVKTEELTEKLDMEHRDKIISLKQEKNIANKIKDLENFVVRINLKYLNSEKSKIIFGTLNKDLIQVYSKNFRQDFLKLNNKKLGFLNIYNLKSREVVEISISELEGFDIYHNIKGWLLFDINSDGWFAVMTKIINIKDVIQEDGTIRKTKENSIQERIDFEKLQISKLNAEGIVVKYKSDFFTQKVKDKIDIFKFLKTNKNKIDTNNFYYTTMKELKSNLIENYMKKSINNLAITVKEDSTFKILLVYIGSDVIVIHQKFAQNINTGFVFFNNTNLDLGSENPSELDNLFKPIISSFYELVNTENKKFDIEFSSIINMPINEQYIRKIEHVANYTKEYQKELRNLGIFVKLIETNVAKLIEIKIEHKGKNLKYILTPNYLFDTQTNKFIFHANLENYSLHLAEQLWTKHKTYFKGSNEQHKQILELIKYLDLRKGI